MSITINHQTNDISATSGSLTINGATSVTNNNQLTNGAGYITSSASISGNAATATVLQTARTINGVSFNGSANITVADSTKAPIASPTFTGTATSPTFNASSVTNGGFQGIDADTALIPSFTWTSDQNTGMWHAAADSIGFTTAGVNRLTLSTTALTSTLNIAAPTFSGSGASLTSLNGSNITTGTVAAARVATLNQNTTGSSGSTTGNAATATALQTARTINGVSFNGTANITVADSTKAPTASPTFTGTATSPTFNASSVTNGGFQGIDADSAAVPSFTWTSDQNTGMWHAAADQIGFTTAGVNRLTITNTALTSTGQVNALTFNATSTTSGGFQGIDADTITAPSFTWTSDLNTGMWHAGADAIGFTTAGVNRITINNSGISGAGAGLTGLNGSNISTGTVAAARVATLNQSTTGSAATLTTARTINGVSFNGSANITVEAYIENDESTNATRYLTFVDNTTASFKRLNEDSTLYYNPSSNTLTAGNFNTTSDIRLKDNIRTFESAMDVVSQLRGVRFTWKETGVETVGLIAQEVEKVLPELIGTNADTGLKSVSYANMVAVLIEAVKELKAEIEELKKR